MLCLFAGVNKYKNHYFKVQVHELKGHLPYSCTAASLGKAKIVNITQHTSSCLSMYRYWAPMCFYFINQPCALYIGFGKLLVHLWQRDCKIFVHCISNSKRTVCIGIEVHASVAQRGQVPSGADHKSAAFSTRRQIWQEFKIKEDPDSYFFKKTRITKASWRSHSNTHKLKWVLFFDVNYDSCFFLLVANLFIITFPIFLLF